MATAEGDLFCAELDRAINLMHELMQLVGKIDWYWIDREIAWLFNERGRPRIETQFVIGFAPTCAIGGSASATCWRSLLIESLRIAYQTEALLTRYLNRVTVEITVQPEAAITIPADDKLLHASGSTE